MPTYCFKVLEKIVTETQTYEKDDLVEVEMKITEYDDFKEAHPELERYYDTPPNFTFDGTGRCNVLPNGFKDRMKQIEKNFPGAKGMLDKSRYNFQGEH